MRTNRPVPFTVSVWTPPVPVVVAKIVVHVTPSGDVWSWNAVAKAASHARPTRQIVWLVPRSTWSHCGSANALDQRVALLPSVAFAAGKDAFSTDDAVVGLPCAAFVVPHAAAPPGVPNTWNSHSE
jgi:hypothetical protein